MKAEIKAPFEFYYHLLNFLSAYLINLGFHGSLKKTFSSEPNHLQSELMEVVDVKDPDNKSALQRREERLAQEINLFNEHHYLADNFDGDTAQQFIEFIPEFYSVTSDEGKMCIFV